MERGEYLSRAREFAARGASLSQSKLDSVKVNWIRENKDGHTAKKQAEILGVHYRTVEKVRYYETWTHIRGIA